MIPCSAAEICRAVGGTLLQDADAAVTNVSTDSRTAARMASPRSSMIS